MSEKSDIKLGKEEKELSFSEEEESIDETDKEQDSEDAEDAEGAEDAEDGEVGEDDEDGEDDEGEKNDVGDERVEHVEHDDIPTTSGTINMNTMLGGGVKRILLKKPDTKTNPIIVGNGKAKRIPTQTMVDTALMELNERTGSSIVAIRNYILSNYANIEEKKVNLQIKRYIKDSLSIGKLSQIKRSFKLTPQAKKEIAMEKTKKLKIQRKQEMMSATKAKEKAKGKGKVKDKETAKNNNKTAIEKTTAEKKAKMSKTTITKKVVTDAKVSRPAGAGKATLKKAITESKKPKPKTTNTKAPIENGVEPSSSIAKKKTEKPTKSVSTAKVSKVPKVAKVLKVAKVAATLKPKPKAKATK